MYSTTWSSPDRPSLSHQGATSSPFLGTTQQCRRRPDRNRNPLRAHGKTISYKNEKARNGGNETREEKMTLP